MCHLDEAGFAMTLPPCSSWYPVADTLRVAYEAPQGRRVNAIGAYFVAGPQQGRFAFATWATLPKRPAPKRARKPVLPAPPSQGLPEEVLGPIDAARFVTFVWHTAGRPEQAAPEWRRERPLMVVLDNYSVHRSQTVKEAVPALEAADVFLVYLPSYSPELSEIEPIWKAVKHHEMTTRSYAQIAHMKQAVDDALTRKAEQLWRTRTETTKVEPLGT